MPTPPSNRSGAPTVCIVGGGASGTLAAIQLLRRGCPTGLRVVIVERSRQVGPGVAYSTSYATHLANVPAIRLSAVAEDEAHFLEWARRRDPTAHPGAFVPRWLYGRYLTATLRSCERSAPRGTRLTSVHGDAVGLEPGDDGVHPIRVRLRSGRAIDASRVLLGLGNFPPADPPGLDPALRDSDRYVADPWDSELVAAAAGRHRRFLIIGTGLTMVDVAISLSAGRGADPVIRAVSRHGLLPRSHRADPLRTLRPLDLPQSPGLGDVFGALRLRLRGTDGRTEDWRDVVDSARVIAPRLWRGFSDDDRRTFLERYQRIWEVHRHRLPQHSRRELKRLIENRRLSVGTSQVERLSLVAGGVQATLRKPGDERPETAIFDCVVNCTGPAFDLTAVDDPLVAGLLRDGLGRPHPLGLGLDVEADGALIDAAGRRQNAIWAIGPLRRGESYETTAIPEIRSQAARFADRAVTELGGEPLTPAQGHAVVA